MIGNFCRDFVSKNIKFSSGRTYVIVLSIAEKMFSLLPAETISELKNIGNTIIEIVRRIHVPVPFIKTIHLKYAKTTIFR